MSGSLAQKEYKAFSRKRMPVEMVSTLRSPLPELLKQASDNNTRSKLAFAFAMAAHVDGDWSDAFDQFWLAAKLGYGLLAFTNAAVCATRLEQSEKLIEFEEQAVTFVRDAPDTNAKAHLFDALAHMAGNHQRFDTSAGHGRMSLAIKDKASGPPISTTSRPRPKFDFTSPSRNIIAFSLFGKDPRYTKVAIENVEAARYIFPGWSCRFYMDTSVPIAVRKELAKRGAQVHVLSVSHNTATGSGLFWRFEIAVENEVDFFLVRDADSLLSVREKVAVDEWIASDRDFHVMRDYHTHSELILAGMWGGVAGRLSGMNDAIKSWHLSEGGKDKGVHNHDQLFLRAKVWSAIRNSVLQHDSAFRGAGTIDFPKVGKFQPVRHVGQNMGAFLKT